MDDLILESCDDEVKEDGGRSCPDGLPELGSGSNYALKFSNNYYSSPTTEKRSKNKSGSRSGRQTPLPPSGLQCYFDKSETSIEVDELGGGSETQGMLESGSQTYPGDLLNAPPLVPINNDGDISQSGDKRKPTPPDLLSLAQMYFERNHKTLVGRQSEGPSSGSSCGIRKYCSVDSCLTLPSDKTNLGFTKSRKLTPLATRPAMTQDPSSSLSSRHALHLSVKYAPNPTNINSKTTLAPLASFGSSAQQQQPKRQLQKQLLGRKTTFVIAKQQMPSSSAPIDTLSPKLLNPLQNERLKEVI